MAADAWDRASPEARAAAISKSTGVWNDWCEDKESDDPIDDYARALLDAEERGREAGRSEEREACSDMVQAKAEAGANSAVDDVLYALAHEMRQRAPAVSAARGVVKRGGKR